MTSQYATSRKWELHVNGPPTRTFFFQKQLLKLVRMTLAIQVYTEVKVEFIFIKMVEKSYNKTVIDFNFGRHMNLSTLNIDTSALRPR